MSVAVSVDRKALYTTFVILQLRISYLLSSGMFPGILLPVGADGSQALKGDPGRVLGPRPGVAVAARETRKVGSTTS
jgi:hypothetical protein